MKKDYRVKNKESHMVYQEKDRSVIANHFHTLQIAEHLSVLF